MSDTSSTLPVCIYCGTPRPADQSICPNCGKPWIDVTIPGGGKGDAPAAAAAAAGATAAAAGEAVSPSPGVPPAGEQLPVDDTGEFGFDDWTMPPEKPRSIGRWLIPILLAIAVIVVWGFVFLDRTGTPDTTVAASASSDAQTSTTQFTTTTAAQTTTTQQTTTTTQIPIPPPASWPPVGDPIDPDDLTLKAAGIGPLDIGETIGDVAGMLTASLGEAEASGFEDVCTPEESYWLQWGELLAIFDSWESDGTFVSYRYEDIGSNTHLELTTLSGLELGDTVADLQQIYAKFTITFEVIEGRDYFRLVDGGDLLLWGPVTGTESDDLVEGIYSPTPCP